MTRTPPPPISPTRATWHWAAVAVLLTVHAILAIDTLRQKSVTVDELGHLPAGITYWQQRTFALYHENPPLVKVLAALPALAARPTVDYSKSWAFSRREGKPPHHWNFGWDFMYANAARYHDIFVWARLPIIGLSLLAGVVVFLWARELFGVQAGLTGLALWVVCPNLIAFAGLVTTDMGATSVGFTATYVFWRYLKRPGWRRAAGAGAMLGLAELTKFSLLPLYVIWPALWLAGRVTGHPRAEPTAAADTEVREQGERGDGTGGALRRSSLAHLLGMLVISVLVINTGYLFEGTGTRLGQFDFYSSLLSGPRPDWSPPTPGVIAHRNRFQRSWLERVPVPLPRHFVEGFDAQLHDSEGRYFMFLAGELRRRGWWWYYPFALAVKVPLGTWVLTLAALSTAALWPRARVARVDELVLLLPPLALLLAMSSLTGIDLGLRYVLPVFPFWFVLISRAARVMAANRLGAVVVLVSVGWNAAATYRIHPDHLAYFNEIVGGPDRGHHFLLDSNLDWGQDLLGLARWLHERRPSARVGLAYFGTVDPSILAASGHGFEFDLAPPATFDHLEELVIDHAGHYAKTSAWFAEHGEEAAVWSAAHGQSLWHYGPYRELITSELGLREGPQPGLFAISANLVGGLPFFLRGQYRSRWFAEPNAYAYFRRLTPIAKVGYSIFIYEVSAEEAARLRAEMSRAARNDRSSR